MKSLQWAMKEMIPAQPGEVTATYADIDKAKRKLGFQPKTTIREGLELFVKWYRNHPGLADRVRAYRSRGIEWREFTDAKTGRRVVQLTSNTEIESKHAYYDVCPWSADGRYIAFSSARPSDLAGGIDGNRADNIGTANGQVCVADTRDGEILVVAENAFYTSHNGCWPMWRE